MGGPGLYPEQEAGGEGRVVVDARVPPVRNPHLPRRPPPLTQLCGCLDTTEAKPAAS